MLPNRHDEGLLYFFYFENDDFLNIAHLTSRRPYPEEVVDQVYQQCFKDVRPFDSIP